VLTEWDDIPYRRTRIEIEDFEEKMYKMGGKYAENSVMFIHCREPKEIERFVEEFNAETLLIRRELAEEKNWENASDKGVLDYPYDYVVRNEGTLDDLRESAQVFLRDYLKLVI
jgi:hypothetical protein